MEKLGHSFIAHRASAADLRRDWPIPSQGRTIRVWIQMACDKDLPPKTAPDLSHWGGNASLKHECQTVSVLDRETKEQCLQGNQHMWGGRSKETKAGTEQKLEKASVQIFLVFIILLWFSLVNSDSFLLWMSEQFIYKQLI